MLTTQANWVKRHAAICIATVSMMTLLLYCGCSSKEETPESTAKVAGTATVKGKPIKGGTLMLMSLENGSTGQGTIDRKGKFEFTDPIPPGKYTVFFAGVRVPDKYQSETSSDYKVTVTEGSNDLKIDLQ